MSDNLPDREEAAEALLDGLGMSQKDGVDRKEQAGQDWLADARERLAAAESEDTAEAPVEGAETEEKGEGWVEDNEEYLRKKLGRDANKWAEDLKERDERIEQLERRIEQDPTPLDQEKELERVKKILFQGGKLL